MRKDFWKNKRVLVTGARGFVGSHLVKRLETLGALVMPVSRWQGSVDVTEKEAIEPLFRNAPSVVFHLAGEALVEKGQESPYETFRTNILGTINVLELSRVYKIPRVIIASTAQVYGQGKSPLGEDDPPRPSRPYETSKTATDLLAQSYADSFNVPVVIPRFVNIYGPGDMNFTRLIPKTLQHVVHGKPVPMWGGGAKREYLYIDDAVEAYLMLATMSSAKLEKNRIFNFGAGRPLTVEDLIKRIGKLSGSSIRIERTKEGREGEIVDQYVSWEKAGRVLGWKPRVPLEEGLKRTIAWYKEYLAATSDQQ